MPQSNWKRQLRNTLLNWRWWVILPYVIVVLPYCVLTGFLEKLVEWNQYLLPYLVVPVTWVRRNFK